MIVCPSCDAENIDGADLCEVCGQPLSDLGDGPQSLLERSLLSDRVASLDPNPAIMVDPTTPVRDVLRQLVRESIGCVVVGDDGGNVRGIFSERDALKRLGTRADDYMDRPISDFMTPGPECLVDSSKIAFAVHRMDVGGFRHVPVTDEQGKVTGVISVRDILRFLTDKSPAAE